MKSARWLLLLLSLAGCSTPLDPAFRVGPITSGVPESVASGSDRRAGSPFFYPLDLGNRWQYRRVLTISPGPHSTPFPPIVTRSRIESFMSCVELGANPYVVERRTQTDTTVLGPRVSHQWIRYRQDMRGLYEADVPLDQPASCEPGPLQTTSRSAAAVEDEWLGPRLAEVLRGASASRAIDPVRITRAAATISRRLSVANLATRPYTPGQPGGASPGDLTRLRYPLVAGSRWNVREVPFVITSTVLGHERVSLPVGRIPAYRVAVHIPSAFGPADQAHYWYARTGWLGAAVHLEVPTDLGVMLVDETIVLENLQLARGRF